MNNTKDVFESFGALKKVCKENEDYRIWFSDVPAPISIIAIHGGGVEGGTTDIASAMYAKYPSVYRFYSFIGCRNGGIENANNLELHITSHKFLDPRCLEIVGNSIGTISVHGADEEKSLCYVGGKNFVHANFIKDELRKKDFNVPDKIREGLEGYAVLNICNRNMKNMGVQLELSRGLRAELFGENWRNPAERIPALQEVMYDEDTRLKDFTTALHIANQKYLCTL